ncbi:helix-turn-helix domain-containing protein [Catellatospora vulcania]|uniref:helix-turn-helix domain-containing protein n=1 Tax=Catellatospora vulcania TaxID=1460450 RepID=UPI0012D43822|nr:helix-turn-helix transcriptional regulator [Catellatospora vulcania]
MSGDDPGARALGRRIAFYRSQRGLSQRDFAAMIDRSETWVSQVERGARRIDRMTMLRRVADVLGVPLGELAADTPVVAAVHQRPEPAVALRMLLSSSLALGLAVQPPAQPVDLEQARAEVARAWELAHAADYERLLPLLTELIPRLEAATRTAKGAARRSAGAALARAYHATAAALAKLGESDAAWVAADRAIGVAEHVGDRLLMAEGAFRLVLVFQADRRHDQAEHTAMTAIDALVPLVAAGDPAAVSVQGVLWLQAALISARRNDADAAHQRLAQARQLGGRLGEGRDDHDTEFGPTNVAIQEVAVLVELGDAGSALRAAARIDTGGVSPERQARLLIDVARAHLQRHHPEQAVRALIDAEELTPEQVRRHRLVRSLLLDLARTPMRTDSALRELAARCGLTLSHRPAL